MRLSLLLFLVITCFAGRSFSQNLIWNGDFESHYLPTDWWPQKTNTDSLDNWGNYSRLQLHLHNYCGGKSLSGVSYIDLRLYSHHIKNYREYAEAKITCPLIKGARYLLRFSTMPIKGRYLIGDIGAYLSKDSVNIRSHILLPFRATIVSAKGRIVDNPYEYTLIEDTITALGGEQYLIIGNFDDDHQLPRKEFHGFDTLAGSFGTPYSAVYVFDDVELIPLNPDECPEAINKQLVINGGVNRTDTVFTLSDIHFATNSAEPLGECSGVLRIIQLLMRRDSTLSVKISGFTDLTGKPEYNDELSLKRAAVIGRQLSVLGIDCKRIFLAGYGAQNPVEGTQRESLINRRVELNIAPTEKLERAHSKSLCN